VILNTRLRYGFPCDDKRRCNSFLSPIRIHSITEPDIRHNNLEFSNQYIFYQIVNDRQLAPFESRGFIANESAYPSGLCAYLNKPFEIAPVPYDPE